MGLCQDFRIYVMKQVVSAPSAWGSGPRRRMKANSLLRIAEALNLTLSSILQKAEPK